MLVIPFLTHSAMPNICPQYMHDLCQNYFDGNIEKCREMQFKLNPLVDALFCEVNPIPAKAAVAAMGFGQEYLRMPLTLLEDGHRDTLMTELRKLEIIK